MTLTELKDKLALEHYRQPLWNLLSEHQQAMLVDLVATEFVLIELRDVKQMLNK